MPAPECSGTQRLGQHDLGGNCGEGTALLCGGGVRAYDVRNPFRRRKAGTFVPPAPAGSKSGAIQINDVYVASDGIVSAAGRSGGGLCIRRFEGRS